MKTLMLVTEKFFATTKLQAEEIVAQKIKEHGALIKTHTIDKKRKKEVEYFVVTVTVEYYKPADLVVTE